MEEDSENGNIIKDIKQNNNANICVEQKNIIIICSDIFSEANFNSNQIEEILGEQFKLEINELGEIKLNGNPMEVKELDNGLNAFVLEEEEVVT
ncbi:MAG: hypothetical protein ACQEP9_01580 [Bacillota bacterium]